MAVEVERLLVTLEARIGDYQRDLQRANAQTSQQLSAMEARFGKWSRNLKSSASGAALGIGGALGGIGAALSVVQLQEYANAWTRMLRTVDGGQQAFGVALKSASQLTDLANDARVDLEAYAKLYARTAGAIRDYGYESDTAEKVTTTLSKALKIGGAAASEQASVLLQFSQALNKGKLDGDEFRSVMENASVVQELLADRLKVSKGEIIKMAAEGKLRIPDLIGAMVDGGAKVERIFKSIPATIDEAFAVLRNNIIRYIGQIDQSTGASQAFVSILGAMGRNLHDVASAALVLGAALLATFSGGLLASLIAIGSRLVKLPALLAAGSAAALTFGSDATLSLTRMSEALGQGATMADAMRHAMNENAAGATTVSDQFRGLATVIGTDMMTAVNGISMALTGQSVEWDKIKGYAILAIGAIIGGLKSMGQLISASFSVIPVSIEILFKEMANRVIRVLNWMSTTGQNAINGLLGALNQLPGFNYKLQQPDLIGEFDTADAYAKAADLSKSLTRGLEENFDLKGFASRVQGEADKVALERLTDKWKPQTPFDPKKGKVPVEEEKVSKGRKAFERDLIEIENRIALQKAEAAAIGMTAFEAERLKIQTQLMNEARKAGVQLTDADIIKINALSEGLARATTETEKMKEAFDALKQESEAFMSDFIKGMRDGKSASELLHSGLTRISDKLIDMAVKGLVEQALGGLTGGGGGGGGIIGALLGMGGGGYSGGVTPFANGGIAANGMRKFANGGVSNRAAIFGEAGPEAAVPLPDGRRIPVELRMPNIPAAVAPGGGRTGGEVVVSVSAGPELLVTIDNRAEGVVARRAPEIVGASVQSVNRAQAGMIKNAQKRKL